MNSLGRSANTYVYAAEMFFLFEKSISITKNYLMCNLFWLEYRSICDRSAPLKSQHQISPLHLLKSRVKIATEIGVIRTAAISDCKQVEFEIASDVGIPKGPES